MKRTPWQRLALSLVGIVCIVATWHVAVMHLYALPPAALASFTTLTVNAQYVIAAIVVFMVTGRLVYEWKMNTASQIVEAGEQVLREDRSLAPKYFDDGTLP